ncbi:MAG TPA: alpha/beta hydrolase [Bacteroidetes bacterium]|nr:alpha/beta hydrolase [Bacteroidota bacterium]
MILLAKIIGAVFLTYVLLLFIVPKKIFLYEGLRLPIWYFNMKKHKRGDYIQAKHRYGGHSRQYLLHCKPPNGKASKKHVIVFFHGGGWQFGRPEMFRANATLLTGMGYHLFLPSHRRIPFFDIRKQKEDVANAMKKIVEIMAAEGVSEKKILLGGVSSGANLAALLNYDRRLLKSVGLNRELFAGLYFMAAPLNLDGMWHSPPLLMLTGRRGSEKFREASPINFLQENEAKPTLLVHPEKDGMVALEGTLVFHEKIKSLGGQNIEFKILKNMTHLDAASWAFEGHPSNDILLGWIKAFEKEAGKTS